LTGTANLIWDGDKLDRRSEAIILEKFLEAEVVELSSQDRQQAYVLGLDAQYGEGKTWFLSRFRQHLEINHPVAFIDAWIDDANDEPLVSIMAALQDALARCLAKPDVKERLGQIVRAAGPILGKAAISAIAQLAKKHLGEGIGDTAASTMKAAAKAKLAPSPAKVANEPGEAVIDSIVKDVTTLVDGAAKAMVDQYRQRQASRETFKRSLTALAQSLSGPDGTGDTYAPIYVIIDELDRCRPAYAISLLEEIKHLFDVPGVVFVIALHGQQLEHSIKAVYGLGFDSKAYLQRFFSRTYELRRLSIKELVATHFSWIPRPSAGFSAPQVDRGQSVTDLEPAELAGELLSGWQATPREAQSVIDGLRIFVRGWQYDVPIELPLVIYLLLELVRGLPLRGAGIQIKAPLSVQEIEFVVSAPPEHPNMSRVRPSQFMDAYRKGMSGTLVDNIRHLGNQGAEGYVSSRMHNEISRLRNSRRASSSQGASVWAEYPERLRSIGRLLEQAAH
jgi:hypothetical protein